jgi:hypothetical protein
MGAIETESKLPNLISRIQKYKEDKHFVYSAFSDKHGLQKISQELLKVGYQELHVSMIPHMTDLMKTDPNYRKKYFVVLNNTNLANKSTSKKAQNNAAQTLQNIIEVFNSKENISGEVIQVMLASDGYNQGVDLRGVKHIHIFEPFLKLLSDKQVIGRAVRHCSHSDFGNKDDWVVTIHRYSMGLTEDTFTEGKKVYEIQNIDEKIYREALERSKQLFRLYTLIQEAAIDCRVLSANLHSTVFSRGDKFKDAKGKNIKFHQMNKDAYGHLVCANYPKTNNENGKMLKIKKDVEEKERAEGLQKQYEILVKENNKRQITALNEDSERLKKYIKKLHRKKTQYFEMIIEKEKRDKDSKKRAEKKIVSVIKRISKLKIDWIEDVDEMKNSKKVMDKITETLKFVYKGSDMRILGDVVVKRYEKHELIYNKLKQSTDERLVKINKYTEKLEELRAYVRS